MVDVRSARRRRQVLHGYDKARTSTRGIPLLADGIDDRPDSHVHDPAAGTSSSSSTSSTPTAGSSRGRARSSRSGPEARKCCAHNGRGESGPNRPWCDGGHDSHTGRRLPRGRCRRDGDGFADALVDHADVRVAMVDRRHGVGGHWLEAYPFVRLHQASTFYGVASTVLGGGRLQEPGPRRACTSAPSQPEIVRLLRAACSSGWSDRAGSSCSRAATTSATARSCRAISGERFEVPERVPDRQRPLPRARASRPRRRRRSRSPTARASCRSTTWSGWRRRRASTSSSARARPRPTPASGCSARASTPTRSAGCGRATRGCSTGR